MARGIAIALAASLLVNVFLGGMLAGKWVAAKDAGKGDEIAGAHADDHAKGHRKKPGKGHRRHLRHGGGDILGASLALSPEARAAVREAARGKAAEIRRDRRQMMELRGAVREALAADPFDRAAAEKALQDLILFRGALEGGRMSLMLDVFESLPAEERRALVEAQEERVRERRFRRRPFDAPPPGAEEAPSEDRREETE